LIGIFTIETFSLVFPNNIQEFEADEIAFDKDDLELIEGKLLDNQIATRLAKEALDNNSCSPKDLLHQIPALISPHELDTILRDSGLTVERIRQANSIAKYPSLRTGNKRIYCLQGLHRIKAAEQILEPLDRWWVIRLHCFQNSRFP
jgi:Protein of unknown function (DUF3723)